MRFTDSHCHLTMSDAAGNLDRARAAGVAGFVVPATKLEDAPQAIAVAENHDGVWAAVGFHPHEAKDCDDEAFSAIEEMATHPRVAAIGEAGLDYHYMHSPREVQRDVFMKHVALAKRVNKPLIIHNRESTADLLDLLASEEAKGVRGILHSYTEDLESARKLIAAGHVISFSGIVTFRNADPLRSVAKALPHDRVLIETDTPFLAPVPHRGRDNEPAYVVRIAELLAGLWGVGLADVASRTTANFESVFSVTLPR
ncbi:MAG TPA: TatD family hydrolase [Thermoanaerobaculia bacterium]|nr:TatD family hydrolase [Thermoanaerobaculia bacterium]